MEGIIFNHLTKKIVFRRWKQMIIFRRRITLIY